MIKKNKKGSHVGIVLSFTLFITFLIFAYIIIGPPTTLRTEKKYVIESIKSVISEKLPEDIIVARVYDDNSSSKCVNFSFDDSFDELTAIVKNSLGEEVGSEISGNNILIEGAEGFVKVYLGNNSFENETSWANIDPCNSVTADNILKEKRITERGIINLIDLTNNSYDEAKKYLEVRGSEFSIQFVYDDSTVLGDERIIVNGFEQIKTDVYARTYKINYIDLHGEEKIGELIIKVW